MRRIPIIIDTDPGIDDAAALGLAFYHEELDIRLISTVTGNVNINHTTENALKLVTFYEKDIPVARGMETPLILPFRGNDAHGETGMDGYAFPDSKQKPIKTHAVQAMYETLMSSDEKITLVPIGPLTNIAMLLLMYPEAKEKIERIVLMGGSLCGGNMNGPAEFNLWADPHAGKVVFESGVEIIMIGLDVTLKALIGEEELSSAKSQNQSTEMFSAIFHHYRDGDMEDGVVMHDSCTIAYLIKPELFRIEKRCIQVVTEGPAAGMTMEMEENEPNIHVAVGIDSEAFQQWFTDTLKKMK